MYYLEMHSKVFTDDSWDVLGNTIAKISQLLDKARKANC